MFKRELIAHILKLSKSYPVIALMGPRQSGKTTLVKELFSSSHAYVNLEDLDQRDFAVNDPRGFLESYPKGVIIDEAQNAPDLFSYMQTYVDEDEFPARFILTGSQNFLLHDRISQSLAGRVAILNLLPFSMKELLDHNIQDKELEELLFQGMYPRVLAKGFDPSIWSANYLKTYIERDVRMMKNIQDLGTFQTFLKMCAARAGQVLDLTSLGNDCGVSHATAKGWINILEASFIVFLLKPHYKNYNKRLIKSPKLFFYDTALLCHLLNIESPDQIRSHYLRGGIFESFVISELIKNRYNQNKEASVYFWRDQRGNEVDCILEDSRGLSAIEIKSSKTINPSFFTNLKYWSDLAKDSPHQSFVVYGGNQEQKRAEAHVLNWAHIHQITDR